MPQRDVITCPSCSSSISIASLHVTTGGATSPAASGAVLKRCPSCNKWAWMNPQKLEAA